MSTSLGLLMFPVLFVFIAAGIPIAFSLISVAFVFGLMRFGDAALYQMISKVDQVSSDSVLAAVPLFIFMGAVLERSGIAERLFEAVHLWTRRVPGGLAVGTVIMCTIFAAASGVVGATETVIGLLAIPVMLKHAYDKRLISGTICAGGSLGTVIPPSITVVVLGPVANVSVGALFAGLLIPGLIMAALFIFYIIGACTIDRGHAPPEHADTTHVGFLEKIRITAVALVPPLFLIFTVLGSILMGLATPTEAAASGAAGTVVLTIIYRRFSLETIWNALKRTLSVTAMILLIVLGGNMFAGVFFASGGMVDMQALVSALGLGGWPAVVLILALTFMAGFVLDLISVTLIMIPVAMPIVQSFGIDPVWFCIAFLVVLQTSYITPPMAPSIFYLRAITPDSITLGHMYRGVVPFIVAELATLALLFIWPDAALWLPRQLGILF